MLSGGLDVVARRRSGVNDRRSIVDKMNEKTTLLPACAAGADMRQAIQCSSIWRSGAIEASGAALWRLLARSILHSLRLLRALPGVRIDLDSLLPPSRCQRRFLLQLRVGRLWLCLYGHGPLVAGSVPTPQRLCGTVRFMRCLCRCVERRASQDDVISPSVAVHRFEIVTST